jgi:RNA polymerase sigma-70 factor (ECF subfamily)
MAEHASFAPEQLLAHVEWVRRLATTLVADRDDADDVAQQTLLLAIERPPRHASNLRSWLSIAARNVARSLGRASTRRREREARTDLLHPLPPPAALVERAELHRVVVNATLSLADPYRTTLLYRFFEGLETSSIATRSGVPVETVRTWLKRGLAQLRDKLAHELRDAPKSWRHALAGLALGSRPLAEATTAASSSFVLHGGIVMSQGLKLSAAAATLAAVAIVAVVVWGKDRREAPVRPSASEAAVSSSGRDPAAQLDEAAPMRTSESSGRVADAAAAVESDDATAGAADSEDPDAPARIVGDVRDESGRPVAGAIVLLAASGSSAERSLEGLLRRGQFLRGRAPASAAGQTVVKTDELGRFEFDGVSSFSSYGLIAQHPQIGIVSRGDLAPRPGELVRVSLVLPAGVALVGRVLRSDGPSKDEIEVHVWAFPDGAPLEPGKGVALGKLDASEDGTFRTVALPYRRFEVSAEVERHRSDRAEARSGIIEAAAGERELRVDLTLVAARRIRGKIGVGGGTTEDLKRFEASARAPWVTGEADGGTRVYFSGSRVLALWIRAVASDRPLRAEGGVGSAHTIRGNVDLAAGTYDILLSEPGMTHVGLALDDRVLAEAALEPQGELGPDLVVDLDALPQLAPTTRVELSVVDAADGTSVGDVIVSAAADGDPESRDADQVHVPSSGRTVTTLPARRAVVVGSKQGFVSERRWTDLTPGTMTLTLAMSKRGGTLRGDVCDELGEPLARASLVVYRLDDGRAVRLDATTMAREDGRFEGLDVPLGRFAVVASAPGSAPAWKVLDDDEARAPVHLESAPSFRVRLTVTSPTGDPLGRIRWRALTSQGVPVLEIEGSRGPANAAGASAADGAATVRLPAGDLTIEAESADGARAVQQLTLRRDTDVRLSVASPAR